MSEMLQRRTALQRPFDALVNDNKPGWFKASNVSLRIG